MLPSPSFAMRRCVVGHRHHGRIFTGILAMRAFANVTSVDVATATHCTSKKLLPSSYRHGPQLPASFVSSFSQIRRETDQRWHRQYSEMSRRYMGGGSCCPPGSWPALEPQDMDKCKGTVVDDIGNGVTAYVVKPDPSISNGYGIISIQDIFEYSSARNFAVADQFASMGFTVVHANFLGDNYYKGELDMDVLGKWIQDFPFETKLKPMLKESIIPYLKNETGVTKIGTNGFCFGAYCSFLAGADKDLRDEIAASACYHPSLGLNGFFGGKEDASDIAEKVTVPQLFVPAGNDPDYLGPEGVTFKVVQAHLPTSKSVVMKDMDHGFVVRGDISDESVKRDVKATIQLGASFLKEHMDK